MSAPVSPSLVAPAPSAAAEATPYDFERPGLALRVRRVPGLPLVSVRAMLAGGARRERVPGQAYLTGRMLSEGTRRRSWDRLALDTEARGMLMSASAGFEVLGAALDALSDDWAAALEWTAELLFEPSFDEERCTWVRRQIAAELDSAGDQPEVRAGWAFMEQLYAPHPRGRRLQGSQDTLLTLAPGDCAAFHRESMGRRRIVTVTGDIDEAAVRRLAEHLFAPEEGLPQPAAEALPAPAAAEARRELRLPGSHQAHLYMGHLTVDRRHPDFPALELAGVILGAGSGFTGRIPNRIREREGLAYHSFVQAVTGAGMDRGRLVAYVGTSPATADQAERAVREELSRLLEEGVTEEELTDARSFLLGREPFYRETARQWADLLANAEFYGLPLESLEQRRMDIEAVDRERLLEAARRHLKPDELRVTLGLPEEGSAEEGAAEEGAADG